ncbi:MAG TPA: TIGR03987 family protein [Candidatus Caccoplasma intestinavium]|uniref:TIGR03987 family protein n=1 Tax=Candidatus Caccoplasma intestinavium TaxID=2840716 RepID=A0A9D1GF37_9BACT|nr:TIGR03987 family protein [Candidatus Caccoplasma intestinavium]
MGTLLSSAIVSITLALIFYSIGTWSEHFQKGLRLWHIVFFILGLCADSLGTAIMTKIAGPMKENALHGITGALALILMAIHAAWAIYTYWKGNAKAKQKFSKFSIFVWTFWLIPYILGIVLGIK